MTKKDEVKKTPEQLEKEALEVRGKAVGFDPKSSKSVENMTVDVEAAEARHAEKEKAEEEKVLAEVETTETKETSSESTPKEKKAVAKPALPELGKDDTHRVLCSSITSRRGVLVKDQGCRANDFPGGAAQLDEMVEKNLIKEA